MIRGTWRDQGSNPHLYDVSVAGSKVVIAELYADHQIGRYEGHLRGRTLNLVYVFKDKPLPVRFSLQLSADGSKIEGQFTGEDGKS